MSRLDRRWPTYSYSNCAPSDCRAWVALGKCSSHLGYSRRFCVKTRNGPNHPSRGILLVWILGCTFLSSLACFLILYARPFCSTDLHFLRHLVIIFAFRELNLITTHWYEAKMHLHSPSHELLDFKCMLSSLQPTLLKVQLILKTQSLYVLIVMCQSLLCSKGGDLFKCERFWFEHTKLTSTSNVFGLLSHELVVFTHMRSWS